MAGPPGKRPQMRPADPVLPEAMLAALAPAAAEQSLDPLTSPVTPPGTLAFAEGTIAGESPALPGGVSLAGLRPPTRPASSEPEVLPEVLAAFDGPRPGLRPDGLAPAGLAPEGVVDPALAEAADAAVAEALAEPAQTAPLVAPAVLDLQSTLAAIVQDAPDPLAGSTARAVPSARRPGDRPRNFDRVVADQLARVARAAQPRAPSGGGNGAVSPEDVEEGDPEVASGAAAAPSGPVSASVAQAATFADAMALRDVNLIGVYGQPGQRRALVRMGNGRYLRVAVGDSLDGGQVTAIGDNALNYTKRGRLEVLVIPGG